MSCWYFSKKAQCPYADVAYREGDVLVFGNESEGLPPSMLAAAEERALRIPIREQVRSLNLSNAVAVVCYEALRQWLERFSSSVLFQSVMRKYPAWRNGDEPTIFG